MADVKDMTALETLKQIPNRIFSLIFNMISRFGVMLGFTFILIYKGLLQDWYSTVAWIVFSIIFLYKDQAPAMFENLAKLKELK